MLLTFVLPPWVTKRNTYTESALFHNDDVLGLVQVSLVSGGDAPCRATSTGPGFSRQEAFDFISCGTDPENTDADAINICVAPLGN